MLLANISVAKKIFQHFPEFAVLRRHPSPPAANYDLLVKAASSKVSSYVRVFSRFLFGIDVIRVEFSIALYFIFWAQHSPILIARLSPLIFFYHGIVGGNVIFIT